MTRVFWNGRSQAVRLPVDCRFDDDQELVVRRVGDAVIIEPAGEFWHQLRRALGDGAPDLAVSARPGPQPSRPSIEAWDGRSGRRSRTGTAAPASTKAPRRRPRR